MCPPFFCFGARVRLTPVLAWLMMANFNCGYSMPADRVPSST